MAWSGNRRSTAAAIAAFALASACGEVKVSVGDDPAADVAPDAGADAAIGADGDGGASDTAAGDVAAEVANECETDFDCVLVVKGKNPCSPPVCEAGKCTKKKKSGVACVDPSLAPSECQTTTCNDDGVCAVANRKDGDGCGLGNCGKKCEVGLCVAATPGDYDDGNPCTKDFCDQGIDVKHEAITDLTAVCDDGDACSAGDTCLQGKCVGQPSPCSDGVECTKDGCDPKLGCQFAPKDDACADGDPCTNQACDPKVGCKVSGFAAGAKCDDGNACTNKEACNATGQCVGTATCSCTTSADCKQDNLCLGTPVCEAGKCVSDPTKAVVCDAAVNTSCAINTCNPKTGACAPAALPDGKACDDGNACSSISTCEAGTCEGLFDIKCDDKNPCTDDACSAQAGCAYAPNSATCNDANPCTTGDGCAKGGCTGAAKNCDDNVACTVDGCDAKSGACTNGATDKQCDDKNPCTSDTCDAKAGCTSKANDLAVCDDGDPCTADKCSAGKCTATAICQCKDAADCNDNNPCTADKCGAGKCTNDASPMNAAPCNTGDKCQVANSGLCNGGVCKSGNKPIVCPAVGACQTTTCNPSTGKCDVSNKADNISCDADGSGCTQNDKCLAGKCTAGAVPSCAASATACSDAKCKSTGASAYTCEQVAKDAATACEDGLYCTAGDKCDGAGKCVAGAALSCAAHSDACNTGTCDEAKDQCVKAPKGSAVGCDDALYCTAGDHCDGLGKCVGGAAVICPGGVCLDGACDEVGDSCGTKPAAAGTACSDKSVCTQSDACDALGNCKGSNPLTCNDNNTCTADSCDPLKGCVYTPTALAACDDGNNCTTGDKCDSVGKCQAGTFTCQCSADSGCNDGNACTADKCVSNKCQNTITAGLACDDKNPCTLASACSTAGACAPDPLKPYDCSTSSDACNTGVCYDNAGVAACKKQPKASTTPCDDGLFCTTADLCDGAGKCAGGPPPSCPKLVACNTSLCSELAKGCTTQPQTKGTACTDGNACTSGDACDGTGKCGAGAALPDFAICDDGNAATSGDLCYKKTCAGFSTFAGPAGPTSSLASMATPAGFFSTSLSVGALDEKAAGPWTVATYKLSAVTKSATTALTTGSSVPLTAVSDQVAVGTLGQIYLFNPGTSTWTSAANAVNTAVKAAYPAQIDFTAVDSKVLGSLLYIGLAGFAPTTGLPVTVQCTIDPLLKTAATCKSQTLASSYRLFASRLRVHQPVHNPGTMGHSAAILGLSTSSGLYVGCHGYDAPWGSTLVQKNGPALIPASSAPQLAIWHANSGSFTPAAGTSLRWVVGSSGLAAYEKQGGAALVQATITKAVQGGYAFSAVARLGGDTLIFGTKPDPAAAANRVPVLFAHDEAVDTQSGAQYWTEITLASPDWPKLTCPNNGVFRSGAAFGATDALAYVNVCSNAKASTAVVTRSTAMFHRPL